MVEDLKRFLNDDELTYSTKQRLQYHLRLLYEAGCLDHLLQYPSLTSPNRKNLDVPRYTQIPNKFNQTPPPSAHKDLTKTPFSKQDSALYLSNTLSPPPLDRKPAKKDYPPIEEMYKGLGLFGGRTNKQDSQPRAGLRHEVTKSLVGPLRSAPRFKNHFSLVEVSPQADAQGLLRPDLPHPARECVRGGSGGR